MRSVFIVRHLCQHLFAGDLAESLRVCKGASEIRAQNRAAEHLPPTAYDELPFFGMWNISSNMLNWSETSDPVMQSVQDSFK
jgi:hypothetical protein